jgi:enterochelin esterase-like enzyme
MADMSDKAKVAVTALVSLLAAGPALAQTPAPAADTLRSPEVHPDHKVTLRLRAPRAQAVTVAGEWTHPPNVAHPMTKDAQGVWSITVGPVEPNIYIYVLNVDGMTITDPVNPLVKLRARGSASMVEVPAGEPWEVRDVPHGALTVHTHLSALLGGSPRQVVVYTPPGYEKSPSARYPVLYLFHGTNDLAVGWTMAGKANLILDNLIAEKKAVPMIVVMPWGHALPFGARPAAGQPSNNDVFEKYLLDEVMPLVTPRYRIAPGRRNRAVVGLSMGGAQALQIGLAHRDLFATVGVFGNGMTRADFESRYGRKAPADENKIGLFYIGIGKEDGALARARELSETLRGQGVPVTYREVEGGHSYPVWRKLLVDTAPLLFKRPSS